MYEELVAWLRSWSELPAHCECYESCDECDKQDICSTFTNERIITKAGEAADAIEELSAIREEQKAQIILMAAEIEEQRHRWIPVTERLPEAGERVLCYCRANIYEVMKMRTDGDWVYDTNHIYMHSFVTHWMPLPTPPTAEEGE